MRNSWLRDSTAGFALLGLVTLLAPHDPVLAVKASLACMSLSLFGLLLNFIALESFRPEREALATGAMIDPHGGFAHDYFHVKRYRNSFAFALAICVYMMLVNLSKSPSFIIVIMPWLLTPIVLILLIVLVRKQFVFGLLLVVRPLFYWLMYGMAVLALLHGEVMEAVLYGIALLADEWLLAVLAVWAPDIRKLLN